MKFTLATAALLGYTDANMLERLGNFMHGAKDKFQRHEGEMREHGRRFREHGRHGMHHMNEKFNKHMDGKFEKPHHHRKFQEHINEHGLSYGTKEEFEFRM